MILKWREGCLKDLKNIQGGSSVFQAKRGLYVSKIYKATMILKK